MNGVSTKPGAVHPPEIANALDSVACPTVFITPDVVKAAYTKEGDMFAQHGIRYVAPSLDMADRQLLSSQMYECFHDVLGVTREENEEALDIAFASWRGYMKSLRTKERELLEQLETEGRIGVVMLARPYHNDPGLNHEIMAEIQKKGYPVFSIDSLPQDEDILERLFGDEVRAGVIAHPMDVSDVWKNAYSEKTNKKSVGRQVRGLASEPGRDRSLQLQVRPRRPSLRPSREDHRGNRHPVLHVPRHQRE